MCHAIRDLAKEMPSHLAKSKGRRKEKHNTAGYRREDEERKAQHRRVSARGRGKKLNTAGPQLGPPRDMNVSYLNIIQHETSQRQHLYAQLDR